MHAASFRIWTQVPELTSYDDNPYATGAFVKSTEKNFIVLVVVPFVQFFLSIHTDKSVDHKTRNLHSIYNKHRPIHTNIQQVRVKINLPQKE